jgi:hypothetical protein
MLETAIAPMRLHAFVIGVASLASNLSDRMTAMAKGTADPLELSAYILPIS